MPNTENIWYVIVNPRAGSGKTMSEWVRAQKLLRREGVAYTYAETQKAGHAEELAMEAAAKGYRRFVAVGGDGTAHELFCGLIHYYEANPGLTLSDFVLAVIPIGSGNDWIKSHNIPNDTEEVVRLIKEESFGRQDVVRSVQPSGKVDYILNVAGVGFDSRICAIVNDQKANGEAGKLLYAKALMRVIRNFYAFPVCVKADGKEVFRGDCYSIAFGVGKWSGGGMRQVPDAVLDDGLLDMMIVPKMKISTLLTKVPRLFNGTLGGTSEVIFSKAKVMEVLPLDENPETVEIDGEIVGHVPVRFETLDGQVTVLHRD